MSHKLKPDMWVKRKYSPKIKDIPKNPLTEAQKQQLIKTCGEKCHKAYRNRMIGSGLLSDFEDAGDLQGEAHIAMNEILNRFDTSRCGKIEMYDTPGATNPKTLEFYFLNYFYGRVNFMACESRTHKKSRNVGSYAGEVFETEYDPVDPRNDPSNNDYEITGHIMTELQKKNKPLQRFFYQTFVLQCSYKELVDEYGQEQCRNKKVELQEFINQLKQNYSNDFGERERKKKPKVARKKRVAAAVA
jgi:hypothetical protein